MCRIMVLSSVSLVPGATNHALVHDSLHHGVLEVAHQLTVGLLHHQQPDELFLSVDPEVRTERAVPPEAAVRLAAIRRNVVHHDFDGEAESHALVALTCSGEKIADVIRGHQIDRSRAQQSLAVQLTAIHKHLRKLHVVVRCGPQSAAAREQRFGRQPGRRVDAREARRLPLVGAPSIGFPCQGESRGR